MKQSRVAHSLQSMHINPALCPRNKELAQVLSSFGQTAYRNCLSNRKEYSPISDLRELYGTEEVPSLD